MFVIKIKLLKISTDLGHATRFRREPVILLCTCGGVKAVWWLVTAAAAMVRRCVYWDFFRCSLSFCFIVEMAFTEPNRILAVTWTRRGGVAGLSPAAPPPPADDAPYPPHAPFKHLVGPLLLTSPPADRVGEPSGTLVFEEPFDICETRNNGY